MKTTLVNEDVNADGADWSVSFDGLNTGDNSQTVIVANSQEAFKLKKIVDDLKEKLAFAIQHLEYRLSDSELDGHDVNLSLILDDIKAIYL